MVAKIFNLTPGPNPSRIEEPQLQPGLTRDVALRQPHPPHPEVLMIAYLLVLAALLSRFLPLAGGTFHVGWMNFTALGGVLLYFGARRGLREMIAPLALLMVGDFVLTTSVYHYGFSWQAYVPTWIWYAAAMLLGRILLSERLSSLRVAAGALLGPTSFFLISNYAVWAGGGMYPHTAGGLGVCYVAGLPFYRNDLISTALVSAAVFGLPVLVRRLQQRNAQAHVAAH